MDIYVVKPGDTVDSIAASVQIPVDGLVFDNQLEYPYRLAIGQALLIDDGQEAADKTPLDVSGYAYPFIDAEVLKETLPWVNEIFVFSYGFTPEGDLINPMSDDTWMVETIRQGGAAPVLTLAPLDANGRFNNAYITELVGSIPAQERLHEQMKAEMELKGFSSLAIDFEYVRPEDRENYNAFVARTTRSMHESGYEVTVAVAPKTSRDQVGILYEGIDYEFLGATADRVMLMTYEWGYTSGCIGPQGMAGYTFN